MTDGNGVVRLAFSDGDTAMKTILSALIALSVLAGITVQASAFDARSFYDQQDRQAN
jgi:hypothetical protein